MVATLSVFAAIFWWLRSPLNDVAVKQRDFWTALTYSGSNMLSFIPNGRTAKTQGEEVLFGASTPDLILALGAIESILAIVMLFMLGLGLRNLFRV